MKEVVYKKRLFNEIEINKIQDTEKWSVCNNNTKHAWIEYFHDAVQKDTMNSLVIQTFFQNYVH